MDFGLTDQALRQIIRVFEKTPGVRRAVIYGSRATGTYRPNSDIDLALWGEIDHLTLGRIASELDELPLPYLFDVLVYERLSDPSLKAAIDRSGQVIYTHHHRETTTPR